MSDADDWTTDPTTKRWVQSILEDMKPKIENSALVMQLVPDDGIGEVKFWVELGASIMMDKPIIAILLGDRACPKKLELIADEIVRLPEGVGPDASEELAAAMERIMGDAE